jgi:lysophospholipase L1-like esterase
MPTLVPARLSVLALVLFLPPVFSAPPDWVKPMREVHAGFTGKAGYVAQFGDSITYSMAFWSPLGWDEPQKYLTQEDGLPGSPAKKRWRDVLHGQRDKGPRFANYSGWRVGQVLKAMDAVLQREKPEMAIIMIGTNDISGGKVPASYAVNLDKVVQKCLAAHCIPILNTIPPRRGRDQAVEQTNQIIRNLARKRKIPLVDYHAEILRLRPGTSWQGTLIAKDGVHPTAGKTNVYTLENRKNCGYALRNWLNFLAVREVYFRVLHPEEVAAGKPGT